MSLFRRRMPVLLGRVSVIHGKETPKFTTPSSAAAFIALSVIAIFGTFLIGCGKGSSSNTSSSTPPTIRSIAVTGTTSLVVGQSQQLAATGTYSDGSTKDLTSSATWISSEAAVATVSSSGLVTAVNAGTSTITTALSGVTGTATVTVTPSLKSITITGTTSLVAGQSQQFTATGTYSDGSTKDVTASATWTSAATAVAIVSAGGLVTAISAGTDTITAALSGVTGTATVIVTSSLKSIIVTGTTSLVVGQSRQFTATGTYSDGSTKDVTASATWTSAVAAIATVSSSGSVAAINAGATTITATLSGVTGTATVTVASKTITSISITPGTLTLFLNSTEQLDAIATFNDGATQDITTTAQWQSSASSLAQVSNSGLVTAVAAGNVTVSASSGSMTGSVSLTVSSSNTGVTFINDFTDSRLMLYWPGDGSVISYSGTRNSDGSIASITSASVSVTGLQPQRFTFDNQGAESTAILSDGTLIGFNWTANPYMSITAPKQASTVIVPLAGSPSGSSSPIRAMRRSCNDPTCFFPSQDAQKHGAYPIAHSTQPTREIEPEPSATGTTPSVSVAVTTDLGAGPQPEDNAVVDVTVAYAFGGSPTAPLIAAETSPGTGVYTVNLPSGPSSLTPSSLQSSGSAALANICKLTLPNPETCGEAAPACAAAETALNAICKAQSVAQTFYSDLNYLNNLLPPSVQPTVEVNGCGISQNPTLTGSNYAFTAAFQCKPTKITVTPSSAAVDVGGTTPLGAAASWVDLGDTLPITSSTLRWNWAAGSAVPSTKDSYLQVNPEGTDTSEGWLGSKFSVGIAEVTGMSATPSGQPDIVTAVETNSDENGTSSITVNAPQPQLSLSIEWSISGVWNGTAAMKINGGNWTYSANLSNTQGGCATTRTESGSGSFPTPIPPVPPAAFTFNVALSGTWLNTNCGGGTDGGEEPIQGVTVQATPASGGYTLSTNTTYPPGVNYGDSQITVTASGFLSVP